MSKRRNLAVAKIAPVKAIDKSWIAKIDSGDGWSNAATGMGIIGRDKGESIVYTPGGKLNRSALDALGRTDGIARKIIQRVVDDALRSGWTVSFKGDEANPVTLEEAVEFNERLTKWYKDTRFKVNLSMHLKQARQYGGGVLVLGAMDGQKPDQPLKPDKVTQFNWFRTHDRYQVSQTSNAEEDPTSKDFGFPESYFLYSSQAKSATTVASAEEQLLDVEVHASRLWRTDGVRLSDRVRLRNEGWGDSVLEAVYEPLSNYGSTMKSARSIVQDFTQGTYKIKNFAGIVLANGEEDVRKRFALMDFIKSNHNAVIVDADEEEYTRTTTSVAGLSDLIDRSMIHVSAVADQPMTLLFGVSPGGFGTGEAEGDNWDDTVKAYQTDSVEPILEYIFGILFQTPEFEDFPADWSINFTSLELANPLEEADIRLKTAQADQLDINSGVLDPDEVALSRYAGSTYSTETKLDEEGRKMDELADQEQEKEGLSAEPLEPASINTLIGILDKVASAILPKETAKVLMMAAVPSMGEEAINAMLDPIEVKEPEPPPRFAPPNVAPPTPSRPDESAAPTDGDKPDTPANADKDGQNG